jgi:hypothetical protein
MTTGLSAGGQGKKGKNCDGCYLAGHWAPQRDLDRDDQESTKCRLAREKPQFMMIFEET